LMLPAILDGYAKTIPGHDKQGDGDAGRGCYIQVMDRSFQGEDGSLTGRGCGRSCSKAAPAEEAAGENDPSTALDLLQSLRIGAELDPGEGYGKACDRINDWISVWFGHGHL